QGADHRGRVLLPELRQRLLRRPGDAADPGVVGAQHGGRTRADLPEGGGARRPPPGLRRAPRLAGALLHPPLLHRDDQRALRARVPHPPGGGQPAVRPHVRLHRGHRDPRLGQRPAPPRRARPGPGLAAAGPAVTGRLLEWTRRGALAAAALLAWEAFARSGAVSPILVPTLASIGRELAGLLGRPDALGEAALSLGR